MFIASDAPTLRLRSEERHNDPVWNRMNAALPNGAGSGLR